MRLFVALDLPEEIKEHLAALIERLRPAARLRWSPACNLHITTKFIGEWRQERLAELSDALSLVRGAPITICVRGLGWFPNPHHPRVFWAGVHAPAELAELAQATDKALAKLGVRKEDRPFAPHLTLARIPEEAGLAELRRRIAGLESDEFGEFVARDFHLYESRRTPEGSVYLKLASFALK